jgi:gamma-glutamyltranspeptidase
MGRIFSLADLADRAVCSPPLSSLDGFASAEWRDAIYMRAIDRDSRFDPPHTAPFAEPMGSGQAVLRDGRGVDYAASDPRGDGSAAPEGPSVFNS